MSSAVSLGSNADQVEPGRLADVLPTMRFSTSERPPAIRVEFFGVPRARAGVSVATVEAGTLGDALAALVQPFPEFGRTCLDASGALAPACLANINGARFTRDGGAALAEGDTILLLSADVGG